MISAQYSVQIAQSLGTLVTTSLLRICSIARSDISRLQIRHVTHVKATPEIRVGKALYHSELTTPFPSQPTINYSSSPSETLKPASPSL